MAAPIASRCPKCQTPGNFLVFMSYLASVDYYRCEACVHAWFVPKGACGPTVDVIITKPLPDGDEHRTQ